MSEEILKALMQLFALITKQDGGIGAKEIAYVESFLIQQIGIDSAGEYLDLYKKTAGEPETLKEDGPKLTSVLDSVKVLKLCKQISKTINQRQKIVVLVRILELINAEYNLTEQRLGIVKTVSDIFRIDKDEYKSILAFVKGIEEEDFYHSFHLVVSRHRPENDLPLRPDDSKHEAKHLLIPGLKTPAFFLRIPSVDLYFLKYDGEAESFLNGLSVHRNKIYLFASGSTLRLPVGQPIRYSDVSSCFLSAEEAEAISFEARDLDYTFPGGVSGLSKISFSASQGDLVGIMGSSGSGKTTLMNVLAGLYKPASGEVLINGLNQEEHEALFRGGRGFVPQDDLLIEELTVFDNLYFNARFCFRNLDDGEIRERVNRLLVSLGLYEKRDLKVGSALNVTISGGQRKRLNIALELIREPSILFLDEPTSGLSSRDSENVLDLLREQALEGKLIFVVIHQPSSELFKMFDRVVVLDEGGRLAYFGNPVEAVIHFKQADLQVNAEIGECPVCGNVNPELIFNIIESRKVDEYGNYTGERKISPATWERLYREKKEAEEQLVKEQEALLGEEPAEKQASGAPTGKLEIPGWFGQLLNYMRRDIKSKLRNTQYLLMVLLVSPLLGFILSSIIRYKADPSSDFYIFRENENIPIFIFMALIVALFLGLVISAEEIFKDRKILKREKFLNLSRSSYLMAKIFTLVIISAIQALLFVLVANGILEIRKMTFAYWLALFSTAVCANLIGLNISSAFDSVIAIYIVIPLVMIPMMVLSGAMFSFEKLNRRITEVDKVPLIAEMMPTKWSYEALMVKQFRDNEFETNFFDVEKRISINNFKSAYLLPELEERLNTCIYDFREHGSIGESSPALEVLKNEILRVDHLVDDIYFKEAEFLPENFNESLILKITRFLRELKKIYINRYSLASKEKEVQLGLIMQDRRDMYFSMLDRYHNESVADHVKKIYEKNQIIEEKGRLYQQIDPVFKDPEAESWLGIRSHFFASRKYFMGRYVDTYAFNIGFIWFISLLSYILLYFDIPGKLVRRTMLRTRSG